MSFGFGLGVPFARVLASGPSYDPADLAWRSGAKRFWWHFDDDPVYTAASGGGSQATAVGDAVASLKSGALTDTYWFNQGGGGSGTLRSDGVSFPPLADFAGGLGSQSDSASGGFTIGFCGYVSSGTFTSSLLLVGGEDSSPKDHSLIVNYNGLEVYAWTGGSHAATIDWTIPHRVVASGEYVGGTVTGRIYLDGVLVKTQAFLTAGSWSRDMMYLVNTSATWNLRSRFYAAQAFTSEDDVALIDRYLCYRRHLE